MLMFLSECNYVDPHIYLIFIFLFMGVYVCICIFICVCVCVSMYLYMYMRYTQLTLYMIIKCPVLSVFPFFLNCKYHAKRKSVNVFYFNFTVL